MTYSAPSISQREAALLRDWERGGRQHVTLAEIAEAVGKHAAYTTAAALVRKGILDRIGRGHYVIRPLRALGMPWTTSTLVLIDHLLHDRDYYVGGPAAFSLHRLTQQHHSSVVDVYVLSYLPPRTLGNARVVFHRLRSTGPTFIAGVTTVRMGTVDVKVSDPERTVLDALEHPHALGGIAAGIRAVSSCLHRVDHSLLVDYAIVLARDSTCQRLGVLLERERAHAAVLERLREHLGATRNAPAMLPDKPRVGHVHPVWRIVENDKVA